MWSWSINITDRRTDGQTDGRHAISIPRYALVHRAVMSAKAMYGGTQRANLHRPGTPHRQHTDTTVYITFLRMFCKWKLYLIVYGGYFLPRDATQSEVMRYKHSVCLSLCDVQVPWSHVWSLRLLSFYAPSPLSSPFFIVSIVLLTICNGEVGNFIMVKNWSLLFYISNDNVTLAVCFYKLNSFYINLWKKCE